MTLAKKFEWYAAVTKDAARNLGDIMVTAQTSQGLYRAGLPKEAQRAANSLDNRIAARKAARRANKLA